MGAMVTDQQNPDRDRKIYERHLRGSSIKDLSEQFGLSRQRIGQIIQREARKDTEGYEAMARSEQKAHDRSTEIIFCDHTKVVIDRCNNGYTLTPAGAKALDETFVFTKLSDLAATLEKAWPSK